MAETRESVVAEYAGIRTAELSPISTLFTGFFPYAPVPPGVIFERGSIAATDRKESRSGRTTSDLPGALRGLKEA